MNTTEKYIKKAVEAAKEELAGTHVSNCHAEMHLDVGDVVTELAEALKAQAKANQANSEAMERLAEKLVPTEAYAFKFES
jgi:hypothetical protein